MLILISMGIGNTKLLRYSERSKPRTTDRQVPVGGRPPSGGNGITIVSGYSKRSEPRTKDRRSTDEGQTYPHRWQMTVSHKI